MHRRMGLPCQDAVAYRESPRPMLALSDGAGSAPASERGAQALVSGMLRLLQTLEDMLAPWLDDAAQPDPALSALWAERLRLHAQGLLEDLSAQERRALRDLRATLQLAVFGEARAFWWKVGDGAIVAQTTEGLRVLGDLARSKGEFANQTCFVDNIRADEVQFGTLPTHDLLGLALMSDGGAERLVAYDGSKVASRLGEWLSEVAAQRFTIDRIALAFHDPAMWERTTLDDRSLILAARPALDEKGASLSQNALPSPAQPTQDATAPTNDEHEKQQEVPELARKMP
jgi:hypothetical protein